MEAEARQRIVPGPVALVAGNGAADRGKLHAYLVPAPRFKLQLQHRVTGQALQYLVVRYGAQGAVGARRHLPHDPGVDFKQPGIQGARVFLGSALYQRGVQAFFYEVVPRTHQRRFRARVLGKDHDARSVPVQAVHHGSPAFGIPFLDMRAHDIEEAFGPASVGGDYGNAFRFFYRDYIVVLVDYLYVMPSAAGNSPAVLIVLFHQGDTSTAGVFCLLRGP